MRGSEGGGESIAHCKVAGGIGCRWAQAESGQFRAGRWVASRAPKPKAKLLGPAGALKHWTSGHRKGR